MKAQLSFRVWGKVVCQKRVIPLLPAKAIQIRDNFLCFDSSISAVAAY